MRPVLALVLLGGAGAAHAGGAAPVIGGTRTPDGAYAAVGALVYSIGAQSAPGCTGTLIRPDVVLTAAHCLDPASTGGLLPSSFTFNHDARASTSPAMAVATTVAHEDFDVSKGGLGLEAWYDIGLVFLVEPVTGVLPMALPSRGEAATLAVGTPLTLVGYGQTDPLDGDSYGVMFDARTTIVALVPEEMRVSMGTPDPQNCHGDSGGPALATLGGGPRLVGVVSRSFESDQCDNGGIDTRVDAYLGWIARELGEDDDGGCCSTGGADPSALVIGGAAGALLLRRRRRR